MSLIKETSSELVEGKQAAVPSVVQHVLDEFSDVLVEELPPGLPPKRSVDHRIERIPGSTNHLTSLDFGCPLQNSKRQSGRWLNILRKAISDPPRPPMVHQCCSPEERVVSSECV